MCVYACKCVYMHSHMYAYMYILCVYVYIYIYIYMYIYIYDGEQKTPYLQFCEMLPLLGATWMKSIKKPATPEGSGRNPEGMSGRNCFRYEFRYE